MARIHIKQRLLWAMKELSHGELRLNFIPFLLHSIQQPVQVTNPYSMSAITFTDVQTSHWYQRLPWNSDRKGTKGEKSIPTNGDLDSKQISLKTYYPLPKHSFLIKLTARILLVSLTTCPYLPQIISD